VRTFQGSRHTLAFFTEVADAFFARLIAEGVTFVPLAEALDDPAYTRSGSIVTDAFQVYQIKIATADGHALEAVAPAHKELIDRVFKLGTPLRPARRGMVVQNMRVRTA
jgi:hypothetical protein